MQRNFHFNYDLENKTLSGTNQSVKTVFEIKLLEPSKLSTNEVKSGWIKIVNNKYTNRELRSANPGKWILQFPKENKKLDFAWSKLVDGIISGDLWEIKVSAQNNESNNQMIWVYTKEKDDLEDVTRVYQYLIDHGIVESHMSERINNGIMRYKTDEQTSRAFLDGSTNATYTNNDIESMQENRNKLQTIFDKLDQHHYVLHGGRATLPGGTKRCSESASVIASDLKPILEENRGLISFKKYQAAINAIIKELKSKKMATTGSWFFKLGARDETTAQLYREILEICGMSMGRFKKHAAVSSEIPIPKRGLRK